MVDNRFAFIDKNTFDVYEEHPQFFICDKKIAHAIATLNKLGYKTKSSCEGHYMPGYTEQLDVDLSFLEEAKNDKRFIVREIRQDGFDCWIEITRTHIYIMFDGKYDFSSIPIGFSLKTDDFNTELSAIVDYYSLDGRRKREPEIENEIEIYHDNLYRWTRTLSKERERGK